MEKRVIGAETGSIDADALRGFYMLSS